MEKKVIIDSIDVSGCVRLAIDNISCDLGGECKGWVNCYYKQLQRLKHQYAHVLKLAKENADSNEYCLQELEQENERLKEENYGLNQELLGYKKGVQASEIIELKQTLQEIRNIADENKDTAQYRGICISIITKINEVIGVE